MCNAYTVRPKIGAKALAGVVSAEIVKLPSQLVRRSAKGVVVTGKHGELLATTMRWGFHRPFSDSINNARSDKFTSRTWAESLAERRCVVPISTFYEWKELPFNARQPYEFKRSDDDWIWVAGLFEESEKYGPCYATITTEPPEWMSPIHDRMLGVLDFEDAMNFLHGDSLPFTPYPGELIAETCDSPLKGKSRNSEEGPQGELF
jgi:putative SOS response-associated peptidase YedK